MGAEKSRGAGGQAPKAKPLTPISGRTGRPIEMKFRRLRDLVRT
jgi:hypothetical protein